MFFKMRKEADDIGPTAELEHWKERMAKFNVYVHLKINYLDLACRSFQTFSSFAKHDNWSFAQ